MSQPLLGLYNERMPKALLVYNPAAGRIPVRTFIPAVDRELAKAGWYVEVIETRSGEHAVQLARQAATEGYDALFAVGGDGTIGQIASGLAGSDTALGVLPAGTANVWAGELGLTSFSLSHWWTLRENAATLAVAPVCKVDMGLCNGHPFLMWAGMGLDALAVRTLEPRERIEKFFAVPEFAASTIWNASQWRGIQLRLWVDGKEVEGHFILAVVNNIRHYMGGLANLSPDAFLDDGLFDLWLFSGSNLADAFRHAFDLWQGRHVTSDAARRIPFHTLRMEADSSFAVQMDGEPMFDTLKAEITVEPQALHVLIPPKALELFRNPPVKVMFHSSSQG